MKKLLFVFLIMAVAISAAQASSLVVGTTFGNKDTKLTTFDYTITQPAVGSWNCELGVGFATGFSQWQQTTDVNRYTFSLGLGKTKGNATLSGGYVIGYVTGVKDDNAYPGVYGKINLKISKVWFAEVKYLQLFESSHTTEGWQGGIGFNF